MGTLGTILSLAPTQTQRGDAEAGGQEELEGELTQLREKQLAISDYLTSVWDCAAAFVISTAHTCPEAVAARTGVGERSTCRNYLPMCAGNRAASYGVSPAVGAALQGRSSELSMGTASPGLRLLVHFTRFQPSVHFPRHQLPRAQRFDATRPCYRFVVSSCPRFLGTF